MLNARFWLLAIDSNQPTCETGPEFSSLKSTVDQARWLIYTAAATWLLICPSFRRHSGADRGDDKFGPSSYRRYSVAVRLYQLFELG